MLKSLVIYNFIIIDKLEINFSKGYSVFTGETGSGKSIILEALLLTVGYKASLELIKENTEQASIIANYTIDTNIYNFLREYDIVPIDNEIIIRRVINKSGSSKAYINDTPVSLSLLKKLSNLLLDMHEQFDNQILLNKSMHISLLDSFIDKEVLSNVYNSYKVYKNALSDYSNLLNNISNISSEQEYLTYVLEELNNASVKENEELELIENRKLYLNKVKLKESLKEVQSIFNDEDNILYKVNQALRILSSIKMHVNTNSIYDNLITKLDRCYTELLDSEALVHEILDSIDLADFDINQIENRLSTIRTLSKKHKVNCNDLVTIQATFQQKLNTLIQSEHSLNIKKMFLEDAKTNFIKYATSLSETRSKIATYLSKKVNQELKDLHLNDVKFIIVVKKTTDNESFYSFLGYDEVTFQLVNNLSNIPKDINKIASGGELARIMLAIKVALVEKINPLLIIFDEIDVGVGGEVAYSIGKKLDYLSKYCQVIVITHSHQVAATARFHYKVFKSLTNVTSISVSLLNFEERVLELARMISANEITKDAKTIAYNLLKLN